MIKHYADAMQFCVLLVCMCLCKYVPVHVSVHVWLCVVLHVHTLHEFVFKFKNIITPIFSIRNSLDSHDTTEVEAAIYATKCFAEQSR